MKTYQNLILHLVVLWSCLLPSILLAENSKDYALMGKNFWVAFECSILASKSKNTKEQERLFMYGYEKGQTFIEAIKENKITNNDISSNVPVGALLLLQGPTTDFMLGRIFEAASENALKKVFTTDGKYNTEEMQGIIAANLFEKLNCELIGQSK